MRKAFPKEIMRVHILKALKLLSHEHWPKENDSTKFDLLHEDKKFPPKIVLCKASELAPTEPLKFTDFSGGNGAAC